MSAIELDPRDRIDGEHAPEIQDLLGSLEIHELAARDPWPLKRSCSREFRAIRESGTRPLSSVDLGVVHCTQGWTARGAASWFVNPACRGSAHVVVDRMECYRTLPNNVIPWGAYGANVRGWHLELTGFAQWDRVQWFEHKGTLERGAYKAALHAVALNWPIRWLSDSQLARYQPGFCTHAQCTRVFSGGHTDPGTGFPAVWWLGRVRAHAAAIRR